MSQYPASESARQRLREAQRLEGEALTAVTKALATRDRLAHKVEAVENVVAARVSTLVDVSGLERAAQLLGEPVNVVRRLSRRADSDSPATTTSAP